MTETAKANDSLTLKEWVFLVWNTAALYDGHPASEDIRKLLNRIGGPLGFSVDNALDCYEPPQRETLDLFALRERT